jgi:hypothetical protein
MARKKTFVAEKDKPRVQKELDNTSPVVVRFYKATCPACLMSKGAWDGFCATMISSPYRVLEVEEAAIPDDVLGGISAFPTYAKHDKKGSAHTVGAIMDPSMIKEKLKI